MRMKVSLELVELVEMVREEEEEVMEDKGVKKHGGCEGVRGERGW